MRRAPRWPTLLVAVVALAAVGVHATIAQSDHEPLAYVYAGTLGSTDVPWQRSNAYLNQPWGIGSDRDGVWVANAAGRNMVRFGTGPLEELGRAGSLAGLFGQPARWLAEVAVAFPENQPGRPTTPTPTPDPDAGPPRPPRRIVWFADEGAHAVVGIPLEPGGDTGTPIVLGEPGVLGSDDAHFNGPQGVAAGPNGNLFVSDSGNHRVLIFGADARPIATLGQTGQPGSGPDELVNPARLAIGPRGRLYVADSGNDRVLAFDVSDPASPRLVQTYGPGTGAGALDQPLGVAVDATFVYVADSSHGRVQILQKRDGRLWRTLDGVEPEACGAGDPTKRWDLVSDVALDESGNIYVALPRRMQVVVCDAFDRHLRRSYGLPRVPYTTAAGLYNAPSGLAVAADGAILVAELAGHRVLKRSPDGGQAWAFGMPGVAGGDATHLSAPADVALLGDGRAVVADRGNGRLVVLDTWGRPASVWGEASLRSPEGVAVLPDGRVAVADSGTRQVHIFDSAGAPDGLLADPAGQALTFAAPTGVAVDARNRWFVSDGEAHVVYRFDSSGRPLAPLGGVNAPGDGFGHFRTPRGLALDGEGRLFVADTGNHRVQVFDADGDYVSTLGGTFGTDTGEFREPRGVAVGPDGRVYVADTFNHRVQVFSLAAEPWLPAAANGFARRSTRAVTALLEFDGRLYAGADSATGAAVWRRGASGPWEVATEGGFGDADHTAVTALESYGHRLYAGTEHRIVTRDPATGRESVTTAGGELWRSRDGERWDRVVEGGFGQPGNAGVSALGEFQGALYAGTHSLAGGGHAPELWRSQTGDSGSWERVRIDLFSRDAWPRNGAISALAAYSDTLVVGTCAAYGPQVWFSADGSIWRPIGFREPDGDPRTADPRLTTGVACLTALVEYDGFLYAGLGNEPDEPGRFWARGPAQLLRCHKCDGTDWEPAAAPGLGQIGNSGRVALSPFDEPPFRYLYLAVGNPGEGLQVWRASDGLDWEPLVQGGFGDSNNLDVGGGSASEVFRGRLHVGTRNLAHGGELWSTGGSRPSVLPTPPGPSPTPRPSPEPPTGRARYHKAAEWPMAPAAPPDVLSAPVDMAVADDATIYILDTTPARVVRLLPAGTWAEPFGGTGSGPERVTRTQDGALSAAIAVDSRAGRVYVSDLGTERVVVFDLAGRYVDSWPDIYAVDLDVRSDGTLWAADLLSGAVRRLAPDGQEIERLGYYGPGEEDGLLGLVSVAEDAGGRVWVMDYGGVRLRAYERSAGAFQRVRTVDLARRSMAGCTGDRVQALGDNVVLSGVCVLEGGRIRWRVPSSHRGSDLYAVTLRTANLSARLYFAMATYDADPYDDTNETFPAVVRYLDDGFDIVTGTWRGRVFAAATAAEEAVVGPVRLSTAPDGSLFLTDLFGLRRFSPDGELLDQLGINLYPSRRASLQLDLRLAVGTGQPGMVIGLGEYTWGRRFTKAQMVVYGRTVKRRYCSAGVCGQGMYLEPIWDTALTAGSRRVPTIEYNYAVAYEPTRKQFVLLQLYVDNPAQIEFPARLFLFPIDGRGRKTTVLLDGYDRRALWTDVDAGPDGRIYVLDTLRDFVQVLDAEGQDLGRVRTPKDAWRVAGGPNGEIFVLTTYGHVVRMAPDGTLLSRFVGLPNSEAPFTAQVDLAVDEGGRVFVADGLFQQITVFEPEGTEADVLEGARCRVAGDKWVAPTDILLGDTAEVLLSLFGTCGFVEDPADIVLAINAAPWSKQRNLRVARQIMSVVDLDRHRVGVIAFVVTSNIEARLTHDGDQLIRALYAINAGRPAGCGVNTMAALRSARDVFEDTPGRAKVLILVNPPVDPPPGRCAWDFFKIAASAAVLKADGVLIVAVNGPLPPTVAASSEIMALVHVAPRGQGVGRAALRRSISRRWPESLVGSGTLTDELPANMDYVPGSASPPAGWDPRTRTLTWQLRDLARTEAHRFSLRIRPREEGLWPTNVEAVAAVIDGWGNTLRAVLPVPQIRVYGELPPTPTPTPEPTATAGPTRVPRPVYLPILLRTPACSPQTRNADVALVIDTSGSMGDTTSPGGPTKLEAARQAARSFVRQLVAGRDQAALVQFNRTATVLVGLTPDPSAVEAGLDRLTQQSGTRIDLALDAARGELTGPARRASNNPVLVLLTDGEPTGTTPDDVRAAAERAKEPGVLLFTIGLGQAVDHALLRDVAGRPEWYFFAPDTSDLEAIYRHIVFEIPCVPAWP